MKTKNDALSIDFQIERRQNKCFIEYKNQIRREQNLADNRQDIK